MIDKVSKKKTRKSSPKMVENLDKKAIRKLVEKTIKKVVKTRSEALSKKMSKSGQKWRKLVKNDRKMGEKSVNKGKILLVFCLIFETLL